MATKKKTTRKAKHMTTREVLAALDTCFEPDGLPSDPEKAYAKIVKQGEKGTSYVVDDFLPLVGLRMEACPHCGGSGDTPPDWQKVKKTLEHVIGRKL